MKRILFFILIYINCFVNIFCDNINSYKLLAIKHISTGSKEGMLGFEDYHEYPIAPLTFSITDNKIYIPDPVNARLSVFDLNVNYLYSIKEKKDNYLAGAEKLMIDNAKQIVYLVHDFGLKKINQQGEEIFTIRASKLDKEIRRFENLFIIDDEIFFYNSNFEVGMITRSGEVEKKKQVLKRLQILNKEAGSHGSSEGIGLSEKTIQTIDKLKKEGKHIVIGDRYYSNLYRKHKEYYEQIKGVREKVRTKRSAKQIEYLTAKDIVDPDNYSKSFIGYDNDHNSYWKGTNIAHSKKIVKEIMIIIDKYGEVINAFYCGQIDKDTIDYYDTKAYPTSGAKITVSPNGDVWFLVGSLEKYDMYKVERQW